MCPCSASDSASFEDWLVARLPTLHTAWREETDAAADAPES